MITSTALELKIAIHDSSRTDYKSQNQIYIYTMIIQIKLTWCMKKKAQNNGNIAINV